MTPTKRHALTDIPITAAVGSLCFVAVAGASMYLSAKTCSVMRVRPEAVGVDTGTSVVLGFE